MANKYSKHNASITDEQFIKTCNEAESMLAAAKKLGLSFTTFKRRAEKLNCYSTNQSGKGVKRIRIKGVIPLESILAGNYPNYPTYKLKLRLIKAGIEQDCCEHCR